VVEIPNVKKPVPLFILMRALGIISDKDIIKTCLLDIDKNSSYIDYFIPSVHDAYTIFSQDIALQYIASFTKRGTISGVFEILSDYFLPHVGDLNFLEKAYFIGLMVFRKAAPASKSNNGSHKQNKPQCNPRSDRLKFGNQKVLNAKPKSIFLKIEICGDRQDPVGLGVGFVIRKHRFKSFRFGGCDIAYFARISQQVVQAPLPIAQRGDVFYQFVIAFE
jgi:hypothetical protein